VNEELKYPVLFVGHGSPMNAIEDNEYSRGWKNSIINLPKPTAIVCISAHWETRGTFITGMDNPKTIHDFYGFPKQLYEIEYPAPGNKELAAEIVRDFNPFKVASDYNWGLDHGCWSILKHMFPLADIPVVQISLDNTKKPREHFDFARQLLPLREKGILIIASGNIVHNLRMVNFEMNTGYDWAVEANETMKSHILKYNHKPLIEFEKQGKAFELAIPTAEHYLPLLYTLALKDENEQITIFNDKTDYGSLSMASVKIG